MAQVSVSKSSDQTIKNEQKMPPSHSNIVEMPEGETVLQENMLIDGNRCKTKIQSIILPESLKVIDDRALNSFTSLQSINIPNGVTRIGEFAFYDCSQLQSVTFPLNLQEIGSRSFYNCISLQSINIPNGVTRIGISAFYECVKLQSVTLPQTLQEIERRSFSVCTSLQSIKIPNTVTRIGEFTFSKCLTLQSIKLPQSLQEINNGSFYSCHSLQSINIPNGVTRIGVTAFLKCRQLRSVILPQTLQIIERRSFQNCSSLQSIIIPESVTRINTQAFASCSALQVIALPQNAIIEDGAFDDCNLLHKTHQPNMINWLQTRFDHLSLHQLCYNINTATTDVLASIQVNDHALVAQDTMGMTPLHILCSNPAATPDMIKQLISKNHDASQVKNMFGMTPLTIYLITKHIISQDDHQSNLNDLNGISTIATKFLQDRPEYGINELIYMGLECEVMDVVLALNGRCFGEEVGKHDEMTGLCPFMCGAISRQCKLGDVYMMAIASVNSLKKNKNEPAKQPLSAEKKANK